MPDLIAAAQRILQMAISVGEVALITWALKDGIIYVLRGLNFSIDIKIVGFIGKIYDYFLQILNGTMFNETVTKQLINNIYVFIGVIVFFRLMMLIVKYLMNPDMVNDAKVGVNALIQRVIVGMCGIVFLPTIFSLGMRLQSAILNDNIIQQIIIPKDMLEGMEEKISEGGKYIGTYVLSGFVSPGTNASSKEKKDYSLAIKRGDLSSVKVNDGGFLNPTGYHYEYFFLLSTVALCYVLYIIFKYCIDLAVRSFKLLIYQVIAPVAMVEYMINGSDDGVFKSWKSATLSCYACIFIRVMALWFVMFVTCLMSGEYSGYTEGSLLASEDYLLRCIIIIALLGFMMDLPKIIGQIFGLDLEQESSATGIMKQLGGMVKGAAIGGLAVGGAAAAGLSGVNSALGKTATAAFGQTKLGQGINKKASDIKNGLQNTKAGKTLQGLNQRRHNFAQGVGETLGLSGFSNNFKAEAKNNELGKHMSTAAAGVLGAVLASNQFTGSAYKGYSGQAQEQKGIDSKRSQEREEQRRHNEIVGNQKEAMQVDLVGRIIETHQEGTPKNVIEQEAQMRTFHGKDVAQWSREAAGEASVATTKMMAGRKKEPTHNEVLEVVTQTVQTKLEQSGIECGNLPALVQKVVAEAEQTGTFNISGPNLDTQVATIAAQVVTEAAEPQVQSITQTVNQVYGTRVNNSVDKATQVVSQKLDQQIDIQREISDNVSQSVEIQEEIQKDVRAQTHIQRNQVSMIDDIRENTERSANSLDNIDRNTNGGGNP